MKKKVDNTIQSTPASALETARFVEKFIDTIPVAARSFICYAIVLAIAFCVFVVNRADPPHIFWDENYHVTSAQRYIDGLVQLEPHPPLGLMLIAAGEYL